MMTAYEPYRKVLVVYHLVHEQYICEKISKLYIKIITFDIFSTFTSSGEGFAEGTVWLMFSHIIPGPSRNSYKVYNSPSMDVERGRWGQ